MVAKPTYSKAEALEKLQQADQLLAQGMPMTHMCRQLNISELTYFRWKNRYDEPARTDAAGDLRAENDRLRAIVAQQALELHVMREKVEPPRRSWTPSVVPSARH